MKIAAQTGGDLRELIPERSYGFDYNTAAKEARNEIARGFCPKLLEGNEPVDAYDTIFIGSPNWFKSIAPPVLAFLRMHDFSGKTIVPFCTHGGGGFGGMEHKIAEECKGADVRPGLAAEGETENRKVADWLEALAL